MKGFVSWSCIYLECSTGSSTLPRAQPKANENGEEMSGSNTLPSRDKATSITSTSIYDTLNSSEKNKVGGSMKQMKDRETTTSGGKISSHMSNAQSSGTNTNTITGIASQTDDVGVSNNLIFTGLLMYK